MQTFLITFHIIACLALIFIVLLQTGRGAEMGAAFGGSSQTLFGSTGTTTFLGKLTTLVAVVFMITCLALTYLSGKPDTKSIMEKVPAKEMPALPEAKPVPTPPATAVPTSPQAKPATTKQEQAQQNPPAAKAASSKAGETSGASTPNKK